MALELVADCREMYRQACGQVRRQFNQVFFAQSAVGPDEIESSRLTDEIGALLANDLSGVSKKSSTGPAFSGLVRVRHLCGPEEIRTPDLTRARGALYQLSYWPIREKIPV